MYPNSQYPSAKGNPGSYPTLQAKAKSVGFPQPEGQYWNQYTPYVNTSQENTESNIVPSSSLQPLYQQQASVPHKPLTPSYPSYASAGIFSQGPYGTTNHQDSSVHYPRAAPLLAYDPMHPAVTDASEMPRNSVRNFTASIGSSQVNITELNASSAFVQATHQKLPQSQSLKQKSHIPIGILIRPLSPTDHIIPEVNFGSNGKVVRCFRCRTYINDFVTWDSTGRRWTCNICDMSNDCPPQYGCPLDDLNGRGNPTQYPELNYGSVEIIATSDYMVRPPQPPSYLFLIEVSTSSVASGLVASVCEGIKSYLDSGKIQGGSRTQIGFITFDSSVHFYKINPQAAQPELIVVPTLDDVFLPVPEGIMVNLKECEAQIRTLLDTLPTMWASQKLTESCLGTALSAAHTALKSWGGKLSVFISTLPTLGERSLSRYRETTNRSVNAKQSSTESDTILLKPLNDAYVELSQLMAQAQICVDLYACPPAVSTSAFAPLGLPTLCPLTRYTAGELRYYSNFNSLTHGEKLREEIRHVLTRKTGWEAVMRIRLSQGWKISDWMGHFYFRNNDLLVLPNCHEDQVFGITIEHHETISQNQFFYLQSALLYTNSDGERRIRVHTYCIPTTQSLPDLASSIDEETLTAVLIQQSILQAMKTNLADVRTSIQTIFFQIYSVFQQGTMTNNPTSKKQFLLPHYILGFLKSAALRDSRDVHPDLRIYHWLRLLSLPREQVILFVYPRLYPLHELHKNSYGMCDQMQNIILPPLLGLSSSHMSQDGAYLLCDGECMMLWLGKVLDQQWLQDVFGVNSSDYLHQDNPESMLGSTSSPLASRVLSIIQGIRNICLPFLKLTIIHQGSPYEYRFFYALIEDKTHSCMMSYDDFCNKLSIRQQATPKAHSSALLGYHSCPQSSVQGRFTPSNAATSHNTAPPENVFPGGYQRPPMHMGSLETPQFTASNTVNSVPYANNTQNAPMFSGPRPPTRPSPKASTMQYPPQ